MTLSEQLNQFYLKYNIPPKGGVDEKTFEIPLPFFTLILPNLSWRRKMLHIHDLEHILNEQDTSWKGEMFIASWEISTGFRKHFPIIIFPLWTMGWGLWKHPEAIFRGFRKGHADVGIAGLNYDQEQLLALNLEQLQALTLNKNQLYSRFYYYCKLILWVFISQLVFLSPLILGTLIFTLLLY